VLLVTGSAGLIGRRLVHRLEEAGLPVRRFDVADRAADDTRDRDALARAMSGVTGIVHLAAISRVVWAERDPEAARSTNVVPLENLISIALAAESRPWLVFASSREVYGESARLPVCEDAELSPLNVYARSKVAGERLVAGAGEAGLIANVARFSNVYGCTADHRDRVVPAFARAAAHGGGVHLEGSGNFFDFTHVDDVADGAVRLVEATMLGDRLPPIHFVTGVGTSLRDLARLAVANCRQGLNCEERAPRSYDVARFVGDPTRAEQLLGFRASVSIEDGFRRLTDDFRAESPIQAGLEPGIAARLPKTASSAPWPAL